MKDVLGNDICQDDFVVFSVGTGGGGGFLRLGQVFGILHENTKHEKARIKGINGARGGAYESGKVCIIPLIYVQATHPELFDKKKKK